MNTAAPAVSAQRRLGRFELRRELGRGAQAIVWLAFDPRLQREVAIKVIDASADAGAVSLWLEEARAVSQLSHPGIVPVFEADEADGRSFLVFELVQGQTLADRLNRGVAIAEREAAQLIHQVMEAVAVAHERGIVHRDLKPSNILIDAEGRARVMDFGIAARISSTPDGRIVGTPAYISPEAAAGRAPTPAMDVYAGGLMLGHMILGAPMRSPLEPAAALRRTLDEDVIWPAKAPRTIDAGLRNIVMRAVARDPAQRYESAAACKQALAQWLQLDHEPVPAVSNGTLEFLLRRMRHRTDFPALSDSVARVQRITLSEHENLRTVSDEIQRDVALTQKLLRMVNSAHYNQASGGITTVSRAAALVGFVGIRNMAFSAVLLEHMPDRVQVQRLRESFLQALLTAALAEALTPTGREQEEAFLCGMFGQLGRLLTEYYLPEEAEQIRQRMLPGAQREGAPAPDVTQVSAQVLGLSFEDLGVGVAEVWGLPETLKRAMSRPEGEPPHRRIDQPCERMRWRVRMAGELVQCLLESDPAQTNAEVKALCERYARALDCRASDIGDAVQAARSHMTELAQGLNIKLAPGSRARRLLSEQPGGAAARKDMLAALDGADGVAVMHAQPAVAIADTLPPQPVPRERAEAALTAGISDITHRLAADSFRLNDVLRLILQTMHSALGFRCVVICLRDPKTGLLTGRFGLGEASDSACRLFKVDVAAKPVADLFAAACVKGADMLIKETSAAAVAGRLPAWHRSLSASGFLLLPMMMKGAPFALIYADVGGEQALVLEDSELALLRTLRNQAVMAFKTAG